MRHPTPLWITILIAVVALLAVGVVNAQSEGGQSEGGQSEAGQSDDGKALTVEAEAEAEPGDVSSDDAEAEQSAQDVMEQLLEQRREAPVVEPTREPEVIDQPARVGAPAATVDLDPAVVGIAPPPAGEGASAEKPKLLPEGTFIVNRRGRIMRSSDGAHVMFVFEADQPDAPETPMILMPCRKLEDMEDYVEKHGDQTTFRLSGQVHTYRGANYLLPTMMVIDIDRGNLDS